ncbi:MAG TPA: amidohydrolase family protein [Flavobacteriales bacterium]|nr:amidohydrolase family protein [Flavobacteriales bacterium]
MKKIVLTVLCAIGIAANAQKDKKWDVNATHGPYKDVEYTVTDGTWLNLDVSPDGKTIVFDMLGDIYEIPSEGGVAKLLRGGRSWDVQPRYSPDGKQIVFCSDAGGGDNIWLMKKDGADAKQITTENYRLLNNPVFTADGNYIVARKHFTSTRSLGAGEIWMYHITGGEGIQLTKRKNDQQDVGEPCASPDGKYIYFSEDMYPGGYFQYNKNPNSQIYVVRRYDLEKGRIEEIAGGPGGAFRPQISRDGKYLAYVKRIRERSCLFVRDLNTGEEWMAYDRLSKDQQEAWAIFGVYSNFSWFPDNQYIAIWANGQIKKINAFQTKDVPMGTGVQMEQTIPFKATVKQQIEDALHFKQNIDENEFTAKMIRHTVTSPDEKFIVFNAVGYLWKKELPNGKPVRLTASTDFEYEPAFSPKGESLVYVTWNDENLGAIWKYDFKTAKAVKITTQKGIYRQPKFSPDGKKVVYMREAGNGNQGYTFTLNPGIYTFDLATGKPELVINEGECPQFSPDGTRIFYIAGGYPNFEYKSCNLNGHEPVTHFTSKYANDFAISPDQKWVAFRELYNIYVSAFPRTGKTMDLSSGMENAPVTRVTRDAGSYMHWSADSKKLHWMLGEEYFTVALNKRFKFLEGAPDSIPPADTVGIKVGLVVKAAKPVQKLALKGARIITMKEDEVIENGVIIINGNKIEDIGKADAVKIPADARVIDVSGKTVMPGMVDVHAHVGHFSSGLNTQKHWPYYANLAYGVTTTHDPSATTDYVFSQSELVKAGAIVGPRVFSTGTILYGAEGDFKAVIGSIDDARSALRRMKAVGAFSVKSYNQPRREQRQMIIKAARELNMLVVPEGGSTFYYNMTHVMDGHTGVEHNIPMPVLYSDVLNFWRNSKSGYTPTLIVTYGALNGENYWYQHTNVWEKTRLLSFTPKSMIDERSRHRNAAPEGEYDNGHILVSRSCKALGDQGVKVNMGAHGQIQGLGAHWETWMLQQGGMSNHDALRAATMNGAYYIGMEDYIGSLEKGKLADLIVMEKNPLDDIKNTETVKHTMVNGVMYDCDTMNEYGASDKKRTRFYWEMPNAGSCTVTQTGGNAHHQHCSCGK